MNDSENRKITKKLLWRIPLYILGFAICLPNGIFFFELHNDTRDYYEQSSGYSSNSKWDGTWKFGDSWTIKLNSKTDEAIVNGDSCYWQDGGDYAVIAAPGRSVIYMRKDGHLYTGDNKGNITVDFGFCLKKQ